MINRLNPFVLTRLALGYILGLIVFLMTFLMTSAINLISKLPTIIYSYVDNKADDYDKLKMAADYQNSMVDAKL